MSIIIEFGRWGLPYLVCIGRWEWTWFRNGGDAPHALPHWRIERSPGSEQQFSETIVHCGPIAHCFTLWPKRTPLPRERVAVGWVKRSADPTRLPSEP